MKLTARKRKWLKRWMFFLIAILLLGAGFYYLVTYRVKDILQFAVTKETKGLYSFNASDIDVSLWKRVIKINNAVLRCTDTSHVTTHYNVTVPGIYLAVQSWSSLIFQKRLEVDSLSITLPGIEKYGQAYAVPAVEKNMSFQVSQVFHRLQKLVQHLRVRTLTIEDGSFGYHTSGKDKPFVCDHVKLFVDNFSEKKDQSNHLLSTDDIDLSITDQHWILPGGGREISFKRLHFSGERQMFELDSCSFSVAASEKNGEMFFTADKLFFNSTRLTALYEKEALYIDTLICLRPVLHLQTKGKQHTATDSSTITQSLQNVFKDVNLKYVDIQDGQLILNDKNTEKATYASHKTNLKVFNLSVQPGNKSSLTTDSVQLQLDNLVFYTADSMFQMTIDRFSLHNRDAFFTNAVFGPTPRNKETKSLSFTTHALRLADINLEDLMQRKLTAVAAELHEPVIILTGKQKQQTAKDSAADPDRFYKTLHGLHDMVLVEHFNIINGTVRYKGEGPAALSIDMKRINTDILLQNFLRSDSLIDIKRSMPRLTIGTINVKSPALKLDITNYLFEGFSRHNHMEKLVLSIKDHTTITAGGLYWEILDWDKLQKEKVIQVERINVKRMDIAVNKSAQPVKKKVSRDLPYINIARVDVDVLTYSMQSGNDKQVKFAATGLCVDDIGSQKQFLVWNNAMAHLSNISFNGNNIQASVEKINVDNSYGTVLQGVTINTQKADSGYTNIKAPVIKMNAPIHSSDFSSIAINSLVADSPHITLYTKATAGGEKKPLAMPLNLQLKQLAVNNATIHNKTVNKKDTVVMSATVSIKADAVHTYKNGAQLLQYSNATMNVSNLQFNKSHLAAALPHLDVMLTNGKAIKVTGTDSVFFSTAVRFNWGNASLAMDKPDSTALMVQALSGSFEDAHFSIQPGRKMNWQSFVPNTTISQANVSYLGKNMHVQAGNVAWEPGRQLLKVRAFKLTPNLSMEETFDKATWQADYMAVSGDAFNISGISFKHDVNDSLLHINKIEATNIDISTARDKRIPFRHGTEKLMPTRLISSISLPVRIDSVLVQQSTVNVHEISAITNKQGVIPLSNINASIINITNRPIAGDSLVIVANATLFDNHIRHFQYNESYNDSLSAFRLHFYASPMHLPAFSHVTTPLAAVSIDRGRADTLFARWSGNKYAAAGTMNFYYNDLKIRLLDKNDSTRKTFMLSLKTSLANLLLHNKNSRQSRIFYMRDREKFVFNYWIKTDLRGMMSSVGVKSSRRYLKEYKKWKPVYLLPELLVD